MKSCLILPLILCVAGCASPEERRQTDLMDRIEKQVQLPSGAGEITRFARAYKFSSQDHVIALYFVPNARPDQAFCDGARGGGPTNGQIALACPPPEGMKAGDRRWFGNDVYLPAVFDGGCNYLDIGYDVRKRSITIGRCHGVG